MRGCERSLGEMDGRSFCFCVIKVGGENMMAQICMYVCMWQNPQELNICIN